MEVHKMDIMEKRQMLKDYEEGDRCRVRYLDGEPYLSNQFTHLPHWRKWGHLESISLGDEEYFHNNKASVVDIDENGFGITQLVAYQIRENVESGCDEAVRIKDPNLVSKLTELYERE